MFSRPFPMVTPEEGTRRTLEALRRDEIGSVQVPGLHWCALIIYGLTMTAAVAFRWPGSDGGGKRNTLTTPM